MQIFVFPSQHLGQAAFVRNSKRPDAALAVALLNICDMDIQRGFDIRAFLFPYGFGDAAGEKFENRDLAVCIICFILTDSNQQRYFTGMVDQPNALQVVLDTFRPGWRPSPHDEHCQPAKHKDREAEDERDPAGCIENIRPAVRNGGRC